MRSSKLFFAAVGVSVIGATAAMAAHVDFNDPRRALGREGDVRIDAQLAQDTLSPNAPVTVTYQIENLSRSAIAVADKIVDTDFDAETLTLTVSIGAEVPPGKNMPHLVIVNSGEKRTISSGTMLHIVTPNVRTPWTAIPRYVQIEVTLIRDVTPFVKLIELQNKSAIAIPLPNDMFDRWVESSESVVLNAIPVYWKGENRRGTAESDQPAGTD